MGLKRQPYPDAEGDESVLSPNGTNQSSLLGAEEGTEKARRILTDADGYVLTHLKKDSSAAGAGIKVLAVNEITNVSASSEQTVVTYTAGATDRIITSIECSGTIYARFEVYKNVTTRIATLRTSPGNLNVKFDPIDIVDGDVIDVKVFHVNDANTGDFEGTIRGV